MSLSNEVHSAGLRIIAAPERSIAQLLNESIESFVGWPFRAATGRVLDANGTHTESFASVIFSAPAQSGLNDADGIPADNAAAVVDAREVMDLSSLRKSYERVAFAKRLKKSTLPSVKNAHITTSTLGIIFAQQSSLPLEILAKEVEELNAQTPSSEWPDMFVVASVGTINYVVQFPGQTSISGDFLPPAG